MITETKLCGKCQSPYVVRNGYNKSGNAQYLCKDCGTCRVLKSKHPTDNLDLDAMERTFEERNSYRSTGRIFGISHVTVYNL